MVPEGASGFDLERRTVVRGQGPRIAAIVSGSVLVVGGTASLLASAELQESLDAWEIGAGAEIGGTEHARRVSWVNTTRYGGLTGAVVGLTVITGAFVIPVRSGVMLQARARW